jgi:hypothetical protein
LFLLGFHGRHTRGEVYKSGNLAEEYPEREQGFEKERETKDDGRYIIFYTFGGEESEGGHFGREGVE